MFEIECVREKGQAVGEKCVTKHPIILTVHQILSG
jgi:hypothetical protein